MNPKVSPDLRTDDVSEEHQGCQKVKIFPGLDVSAEAFPNLGMDTSPQEESARRGADRDH